MPSAFFPSSFRTLGPLLILLLSYANVFSQITIKERVAIEPKVQLKQQPMSVPSGPLLTLDGMTVKTTMPGVVITGSVSISPETIPNNTGYEVWVNVGGSSHMIRKEGTGYCRDTSAQESSPFPATLQSCGVIGMSATTFVPAPWQWSCAVRGTNPDTPQVSGNSATLKVNGTLWYTGFTATLTISASLDESYQVTQVIAEPQDTSLTCNGATAVDVTILDGHGNLYVPCGGTQLMGTATINAKGAYAFLEGNGQSGRTIDFAVNNGRGAFLVVLDTSKGIIPKGFDTATITATVNGVNGETTVAMSCQYPPPTVQITDPPDDLIVEVSALNQPVIVLAEEHTPIEGQFVPSIIWDPSAVIATSEYFDQIEDTLVLIVKVTAENDGGTARDSTKILLVKTSGVPIIDSVRTSTGETVFPIGTTVTLEGYYRDPDFDYEYAGWGTGPPPPVITTTASGAKPIAVASSTASSSPSTGSLLATGEGTIQNLGENTFTFFVRDAAGNEASRNLMVYGVAPCPNQGVVYLVNKQHQDANQFCVRGTDFIAVGATGFAVNLPYDFAGVETCFDESRRCWTQRLNYIAKNIVYGVCSMYLAGLVDVSEVPLGITKEQACRIVADLRRIISNEKAWISKNQYYSYQAILKHEEVHADLLEAMLKSFGDAAESELRLKCLNEGKARTLQEAVRLLGTPRIVNAKLSEQFDKFRELKKHSSEARAALEGNKFRRQLINGIEVRYGKCSAGTF